MKKKLIKFFVIPLTVFVICLFTVPAYLLAGPDDYMADAVDAPAGAEGDFSATEYSDQGTTFSSFGNIDPQVGGDFVVMSTGDVFDNESGTDDDTDFNDDDIEDWALLELYSVTVPAGSYGFTFDLYYITNESAGSEYDYFEATLSGSSEVPVDTVIAYVDAGDVKQEKNDLDGTAFENDNASGWGTAGGPVNPGDNVSIDFYLTDTSDGIIDSAVILDNFQFTEDTVKVDPKVFKKKKKEAPEPEPVWIRTMPMTCYQVWINEDNMFEFIFWYPYRDNNWVQIFDKDGILVYEADVPVDDPHIVVDLPDGIYTVQTFHEAGKIIQEIIIGKPAPEM